MIDRAGHHSDQEDGLPSPSMTALAWDIEPEPLQGSSLEWYLIKLLEPTAEAPHEPAPLPAEQRRVAEFIAPPPCDTAETPPKPEPLSPPAEKAPAKAHAGTRVARAARPKSAIRSYARKKEEPSGSRQKVMMAIIPVLATTLVVLLRNPLGARPAGGPAMAAPTATVAPVVPDVEIAWELPARYEFGDRDPMRWTLPVAVAVENAQATGRPMEPPVDLRVTGILYSEDRPTAIVETQLVREGQQILGATVEKIDTDGVQFERNGRRWKQPVTQ